MVIRWQFKLEMHQLVKKPFPNSDYQVKEIGHFQIYWRSNNNINF